MTTTVKFLVQVKIILYYAEGKNEQNRLCRTYKLSELNYACKSANKIIKLIKIFQTYSLDELIKD